MICFCCDFENAKWNKKFNKILCQKCLEVLERLKRFVKRQSVGDTGLKL